jgi:hypothetical protein
VFTIGLWLSIGYFERRHPEKKAPEGQIIVIGDKTMQTENLKENARKLVDDLPDGATRDDMMYRIYVHQAIEAGIKDSDQGRTLGVEEVRKRFGLAR